MGFPPSKTVYASAVQLCPLSDASTPYQTMLDYDITYLDGFVDMREWAMLYYKAGKGNLKKYANYIKKLTKEGKNPFTDYLIVDPESTYDTTLDGLRTLVLSDLGYTEEEVESLTISVVNPNYDEATWIKYKLDGFDWDSDNITIEGTVYTIKDYWFNDLTTIRVYLVDANGNQIEKTIPAYNLLDSTSEPIVAQEYLYAEYEIDGKTHVYMSPIPASSTTSSYVYTAKNGSTFDYTKTADRKMYTLPMMPLKVGGDGMGWGPSTITEKRNLPKNSKFRNTTKLISDQKERIENKKKQLEEETDATKKENIQKTIDKYEEQLKDYEDYATTDNNTDLTGINRDPHKCIQDYYKDSSETEKLYKKAEWVDKCENYDIYKTCMKRAGTTIESHMCAIYDVQCGFSGGADTGDMREQLYDCYQGYGCPMHAIKTTNVYEHANSTYDDVYARLKANTKHPEVAAYAKYTRYSNDEIFEDDDHFAEINLKKYKTKGMKAIAKYCFKFFDLFQGTSGGKKISLYQREDYNYRATHKWTQFKKKKHTGQAKYRYCYDWTATKAQTSYLYEITYTGKMELTPVADYNTRYEEDKTYTEFSHWLIYFRPVYLVKVYQIQIETEVDDNTNIYESIDGIPINAKYYQQTQAFQKGVTHTDSDGNVQIDKIPKDLKYTYIETKRNGTLFYTKPNLNITMKRLYSIKETSKVEAANITLAGKTLRSPYNYWLDDVETYTTHYYTKGTYCVDKDSIMTAVFDKDIDVTLLEYNVKDLFIDKTKEYGRYSDENNPPSEIRTDLPYDVFKESLLPETGSTYVLVQNDDDWEGERIIFRYFHNINKWQYEEIRVEDYSIVWAVNPREGGEHQAASLSCLAPDGNSFLPIFIDIINDLSFMDALVVYQYSSKEYWSYWIKKEVKVSLGNFLLSIVFTGGIGGIAAIFSDSAYFEVMKAFSSIMNFVGLHGLLKVFGLDNTIVGAVIEAIVDIVLTVLTAGAYTIVLVSLELANLALNLYKLLVGRNQQDAIEDFNSKMQLVKDKQLELRNLNEQLTGGGLTLVSIVNRVHRFADINRCTYKYINNLYALPDTNCDSIIYNMINLGRQIPTTVNVTGSN